MPFFGVSFLKISKNLRAVPSMLKIGNMCLEHFFCRAGQILLIGSDKLVVLPTKIFNGHIMHEKVKIFFY